MKKLFISQPMRGKTDEEILAVRAQAIQSAERVLREEVEVIDSFFKGAAVPPTVLSRSLWFLGESLKLLSGADVAYFADGWEDARGCKIEHECAIEYGITTIEDYRQATIVYAKREIAEMPGHWISLTDCSNAGVYCSICHKKVYKEDYAWCNRKNKLRSPYCPNCGAKMDGGAEG